MGELRERFGNRISEFYSFYHAVRDMAGSYFSDEELRESDVDVMSLNQELAIDNRREVHNIHLAAEAAILLRQRVAAWNATDPLLSEWESRVSAMRAHVRQHHAARLNIGFFVTNARLAGVLAIEEWEAEKSRKEAE